MPLRAILAMEIYQHDNLLTPAEGAPTGSGVQPKQGPASIASKVPRRAARILLGAASPSLATGLMVGPSERIAEISDSKVVTRACNYIQQFFIDITDNFFDFIDIIYRYNR